MSRHDEPPSAVRSPRDVLRDMWTSRRAEAENDTRTLLETLKSLTDSPADAELRQQAQILAHQLVGVFGVFGFTDVNNQMVRVDIELADTSISVAELIVRVEAIYSQLP